MKVDTWCAIPVTFDTGTRLRYEGRDAIILTGRGDDYAFNNGMAINGKKRTILTSILDKSFRAI
jgi:hypothetical protein